MTNSDAVPAQVATWADDSWDTLARQCILAAKQGGHIPDDLYDRALAAHKREARPVEPQAGAQVPSIPDEEVSEKDDADGEPCTDCGRPILDHPDDHEWRSAEPELPWDMPSADKLVYKSIAARSPEERSYLQHMTKKYVDMTAQAIINCDALRERATTAETALQHMTEDRNLWRDDHEGDCPVQAAQEECLQTPYDPENLRKRTRIWRDEISAIADHIEDIEYAHSILAEMYSRELQRWVDAMAHLRAIRAYVEEAQKTPITRDAILAQSITFEGLRMLALGQHDEMQGLCRLVLSETDSRGKA